MDLDAGVRLPHDRPDALLPRVFDHCGICSRCDEEALSTVGAYQRRVENRAIERGESECDESILRHEVGFVVS
jgi:hypothetical protein